MQTIRTEKIEADSFDNQRSSKSVPPSISVANTLAFGEIPDKNQRRSSQVPG
jgi:hypothetical protein